jgi:SHS2 domain-containing protein
MTQPFQEIEHTADRAFTARGRDMRDLFVHAAQAMFRLQPLTTHGWQPVKRNVDVIAPDRETLLVNWLNELLYLSETLQERYDRFEILELTNEHIQARLHGAQLPSTLPVKAVTFHNLTIRQEGGQWVAALVVDV